VEFTKVSAMSYETAIAELAVRNCNGMRLMLRNGLALRVSGRTGSGVENMTVAIDAGPSVKSGVALMLAVLSLGH
jgi:hypothetical protein